MRDHPDIEAALATGYTRGYQENNHRCPVCGEELWPDDEVYMNWREVIGCKHCIEVKEASETWGDE